MIDGETKEGAILRCFCQALLKGKTPDAPIEMEYQGGHRAIHTALELTMPELKLGAVREGLVVSLNAHDYCVLYTYVYRVYSWVREALKEALHDEEQLKTTILSIVPELTTLFQNADDLPKEVILNVIHDALHDILTDLRVKEITPFAQQFRLEARYCFYGHLNPQWVGEVPSVYSYFLFDKYLSFEKERDMEDVLFVARQLQTDVGASFETFERYFRKTVLVNNG